MRINFLIAAAANAVEPLSVCSYNMGVRHTALPAPLGNESATKQ